MIIRTLLQQRRRTAAAARGAPTRDCRRVSTRILPEPPLTHRVNAAAVQASASGLTDLVQRMISPLKIVYSCVLLILSCRASVTGRSPRPVQMLHSGTELRDRPIPRAALATSASGFIRQLRAIQSYDMRSFPVSPESTAIPDLAAARSFSWPSPRSFVRPAEREVTL
jgi:hypothetical protein